MSLTPEELAALDLAVETLKRSGLSVESEDLLTFISRRRWTTSWRPVTSMSLGSRMAISIKRRSEPRKGRHTNLADHKPDLHPDSQESKESCRRCGRVQRGRLLALVSQKEVRIWPKADIERARSHVCFREKSRHD